MTAVLQRLYDYGHTHEWKYDAKDPFAMPGLPAVGPPPAVP